MPGKFYRSNGLIIVDYNGLTCLLTCTLRGILHDPEIFEDPMAFKPERYLKDGEINPDILDPMIATFGFGRRYVPSF